MKNSIECPNCGHKNNSIDRVCKNCHFYLREKIANIDLWTTFWKMLETPRKAFQNIFFAEKKNYVFILLFVLSFKFCFNGLVLANITKKNIFVFDEFYFNLLLSFGYFFLFIFLFSLFYKLTSKIFGIYVRYKDSYTLFTYSLWPMIFAVVILSLLQYALFGEFYFTFNPSPFIIKPFAAYVLLALEALTILFTLYLAIWGIYVQTGYKIYAFVFGVIFIVLLHLAQYLLPFAPFAINL